MQPVDAMPLRVPAGRNGLWVRLLCRLMRATLGASESAAIIRNLGRHMTRQPKTQELLLQAVEASLPETNFVQQFDNPGILGLFPELREQSERYSAGMHKPGVRDPNRILLARFLLDLVRPLPAGDYLEIGTYQGNFARLIWAGMPDTASLYCLDTFEGFHAEDVAAEQQFSGVRPKTGHYADTTMEAVARAVCGQAEHARLQLVKGRFPESFAGLTEKEFRFVHVDCDLYEPTRHAVALLWPRLVAGGAFLIHDYHALYNGVRKAVDEYFLPRGIVPLPYCDKSGSVVVIKHPACSPANAP